MADKAILPWRKVKFGAKALDFEIDSQLSTHGRNGGYKKMDFQRLFESGMSMPSWE